MSNLTENLEDLTYQMSDEEISLLSNKIFTKNKEKYNIVVTDDMSDEYFDLLTGYLDVLPLTSKVMNSMAKLGYYTKEELEEENRRRYVARRWEEYL